MSASEERPDDHREPLRSRVASEDASVPAERWYTALKRRIGLKVAAILGRLIASLERLNARLGAVDEDSEQRPRHKTAAHPAPAVTKVEESPPVEVKKKSHRLRNAFSVLLVILLSAGIGAGVTYTLFSRMLKDQSTALDSHEQDIHSFQLEEKEQSAKLSEWMKKFESEQKLLTEMEARLVAAEQQRVTAEAKLKQLQTEVPKAQVSHPPSAQGAEQPAKALPGVSTEVVQRPSKASTFRPPSGKTGNCNLAGSDPAALTRCIEEYNRK